MARTARHPDHAATVQHSNIDLVCGHDHPTAQFTGERRDQHDLAGRG
ncbi:hypothetical protein [Nonomuraea antimicrobica]